jgi:hypothetical protein
LFPFFLQKLKRETVSDFLNISGHRSQVRDQRPKVRSQQKERPIVGGQNMQINSAKDLEVYKKGYRLAMRVFELSKKFPAEEKYALTGQIRRSSRSICLNLREAWLRLVEVC